MNTRNWLILAGITGVLATKPALAGNIPQPKGQFATTASGSFGFCLNPSTFAPEACSTTGVLVVPLTLLNSGVVTLDKSGNSCSSVVQTVANFPVDATPPTVTSDEHTVGTLKTYDSSSGVGDASFITYSGGSCKGASFDSTGATELSSGIVHFVVSEQGKWEDFQITSLNNSIGSVGDFSISGVQRTQ
jgi:hypothetical protein